MDFAATSDEALIAETLDQILRDFRDVPIGSTGPFVESEALESVLAQSGFYDVCAPDGPGPVAAVLLIEAVARTPFALEVAARALVGPMTTRQAFLRPLALARSSTTDPVRFLKPGGSVLIDAGDHVRLVLSDMGAVAVASPFAFPYARRSGDDPGDRLDGVPVAVLRQWRRVALCAEAAGAMRASLDLTCGYVTERHQFGRAIGSFQAVQHRLAECACLLEGGRWLTFKAAASTDPLDALIAVIHVQDSLRQFIYETNQLHGAIGLTLEYPLHHWSYRLRALQGELSGASRQADDASYELWPEASVAVAAPISSPVFESAR